MAKADQISTRFNILYILHILKNHSDKNHPISIAEITKYLEQDLEKYGILLDRTTILRTITALEDDFIGHFQKGNHLKKDDAERMNFGLDFGFYVGRKKVMKDSSQDKKKTKNNSIYKYYYESDYSGFENIKGSNDLRSKSEYRMKNPIMYSGVQKRFHLLVNASTNNMMNTIMDVFGNIDDTFGLENKKTVPVSTDTATACYNKYFHFRQSANSIILFFLEKLRKFF